VVKEIHPFEWYQAQAEAWKQVIDRDPKNGAAWLYYYTANRMMWLTENERWEKLNAPYIKSPSEIVVLAKKAIPGTFEALYIDVWNNPDAPDHEASLMKAYDLGKGRPEILDEMAMFYEIRRDVVKRKEINTRWFSSNDIPRGILNFNFNVLMTLPDDAIIITGGDNDTFPLWVLQDALGIKKGVTVFNISLLAMKEYREKIFGEVGIPDIPFHAALPKGKDTLQELRQIIFNHLLEKAKRPVYLALTINRQYYSGDEIMNDLYLEGLALRYDKKGYDNLGVIRRHFENDYLLDYLKVSFGQDASKTVTDQMNTAYLPALVKLCNHYRAADETARLAAVRRMIFSITQGSGNQDEFREMEPYINCN
jgi:hypothetical protein